VAMVRDGSRGILWYVHQVNNNYRPPMADYLCGTAYVRLPQIEQRGWALLI